MSEETYVYLCNKLRPAMERQDTTFRVCIPLKKRVAIALWKLATGSEYRSIGHLFGVSNTTVCRCVQDFCAAAEALLVPELIRSPDREQFAEMAAYTENRWGLPQCVGAIDGSHIPILAPQENHCDYFNQKGWHAIILQGVVDGKGHFWNVFAGMPGSMHDAQVLRLSTLWELASRGDYFPPCTRDIGGVNAGYYILGDNAYPLQSWLLKPFPDTGQLTAEHVVYNKNICRARVVVENAFGRLKGRQLSTEQAVLQESLHKESMENEELMWKLHNGDLSSPRKVSPTSTSPRAPSASTNCRRVTVKVILLSPGLFESRPVETLRDLLYTGKASIKRPEHDVWKSLKDEVLGLIMLANLNRSKTAQNDHSSRSRSAFQLDIEGRQMQVHSVSGGLGWQ
ncbi:hypothetical protein JOQ06_022154 [Pogonophryne albipinna]|uniref:DDE Tnp4 domain-containing protein n=1 Tax=Pogonophryne albipinna TaxID=1090488 RepID=A0AAD6A5P3_9TELE|nr:hypothetical protein JOQ06_022154 [Pogonophryne albipinna]